MPRRPTWIEETLSYYHGENCGFCAECEAYAAKALVSVYGYKVSTVFLRSSVVEPSVSEIVTAAAAAAAREKMPLIDKMDDTTTFLFTDDLYIEMFDDNESRFFYHNVATGGSTWKRPTRYIAYDFTRQQQEGAKEV